MSTLIHGKELISQHKLQGFEFVQEYVLKGGLIPYDDLGQPIRPEDVMIQYCNKMEPIWSYGAGSSSVKAQQMKAYLESIRGLAWAEFEFAQDPNMARYFISTLLNAFYRQADLGLRDSPRPMRSKSKKQIHRGLEMQKCRAKAKELWDKHPLMRKMEMVRELYRLGLGLDENGNKYPQRTVLNWIADLCPHNLRGPTKKKTD